MCLAKMLPDERYYVFTSAPNVAMEVVSSTSSTVNLTGGEINSDNLAVSGAGAVEFMENVNYWLQVLSRKYNIEEELLTKEEIAEYNKKILANQTFLYQFFEIYFGRHNI